MAKRCCPAACVPVSLGEASVRVDRHRAVASRPAVDGAGSRVANREPATGTGHRMEFLSLLVELFVRRPALSRQPFFVFFEYSLAIQPLVKTSHTRVGAY